ncbi:MAG: zinc ribbon domain-containing protein [Promethearchaeota archaeon]|nr:MAG: zinc ribbon domain-containing protein [Candidatus Lokiarchaeota archaeon]
MDKQISIYLLPRANLRGKIDLCPIVKSHINGFPDRLNIYIAKKFLHKSENVFLFLKIFSKIETHFRLFLETCYEIHIFMDVDLDILTKLYIEKWDKNNNMIPPKRRKLVEKKIFSDLANNGTQIGSKNLNFFRKYFKMSVNSINWARKEELWKQIGKKKRNYEVSQEQRDRLYIKYKNLWDKYSSKIILPDELSPAIDNALKGKENLKAPPKKISHTEYTKLNFCPMCGADASGNFCANCGHDLRSKSNFCQYCGSEIDRSSISYCPNCGKKL